MSTSRIGHLRTSNRRLHREKKRPSDFTRRPWMFIWWTARGSNPRPPHCERGALPAELAAHSFVDRFEGFERFEMFERCVIRLANLSNLSNLSNRRTFEV